MNQELTHDEIIFRVLLQREEFRPTLTFSILEESVPKTLRKSIEKDWRLYIRNEGLEFDTAFQKAVRKHIPGLHFIIIAAEFLGKISFHSALAHFLKPDKSQWSNAAAIEAEVFNLAERLENEFRKKQAKVTYKQQKKLVLQPPPKSSGPTRKCYFCRKQVPTAELYQHVDTVHLNPAYIGGISEHQKVVAVSMPKPNQILSITDKQILDVSPALREFDRFRRPRCGCGNIAIPGDFYCYHCAPD